MHKENCVKSQVLNDLVAQNKESNSFTVQCQKVTANYVLSFTQLN